jgi:hypothetical protein
MFGESKRPCFQFASYTRTRHTFNHNPSIAAMFSGDTDGFDVFDEDNREDFSHLTPSTKPTTPRQPRQHAASQRPPSAKGKLADRQVRDMEDHMQDPDNNNEFRHSRTQSEDDVDMDTDTERLLSPANGIVPTITDDFEEDLQREVAYVPGLMAATEGENVILSHQVLFF